MISLDMPAVKFDKYIAYATSTCAEEKAPALLAHTWGRAYNKLSEEDFARELAQLERNLDEEILGGAGATTACGTTETDDVKAALDDGDHMVATSRSVSLNKTEADVAGADEVFVHLSAVARFLINVGMPEDAMKAVTNGLAHCADLFVDPLQRNLRIRAPVDIVMATDNRMMVHTLRSNGMGHLVDDYGWHLVTSGTVTVLHAEGDHLTFTETELGMRQLAACFDRAA